MIMCVSIVAMASPQGHGAGSGVFIPCLWIAVSILGFLVLMGLLAHLARMAARRGEAAETTSAPPVPVPSPDAPVSPSEPAAPVAPPPEPAAPVAPPSEPAAPVPLPGIPELPAPTLPDAAACDDTAGVDSRIRDGLEAFVRDRKYLDPDMSLEKLSKRIRTNRSYLNETLYLIYGHTYNEFINRLRIMHARELILRSKGSASLKSVSIDSGYRSMTTFYRNFTRFNGCCPADWRDRVMMDGDG